MRERKGKGFSSILGCVLVCRLEADAVAAIVFQHPGEKQDGGVQLQGINIVT